MSKACISVSSGLDSNPDNQNDGSNINSIVIEEAINLVRPFHKVNVEGEEKKLTITSSSELTSKPQGFALEFKNEYELRIEFEEEMRFEYQYEIHSLSSGSSETVKPIPEEVEESKSLINELPINTTSEKLPEQSPHWKRIDVRQKKITRGLSSLSKEFINAYLGKEKDKRKKFFPIIDKLLK